MSAAQNGVPRWVEEKLRDLEKDISELKQANTELARALRGTTRLLDRLMGKVTVWPALLAIASGLLASLLTIVVTRVLMR